MLNYDIFFVVKFTVHHIFSVVRCCHARLVMHFHVMFCCHVCNEYTVLSCIIDSELLCILIQHHHYHHLWGTYAVTSNINTLMLLSFTVFHLDVCFV